jgi:putative transposase
VTETVEPVAAQIDQQRLAEVLVAQAREEGVQLVGEGGLLTGLTKAVVETAPEEEISEHLGYDKHDPAGRNGGNSRNSVRSKSVLTEIGPVNVEVPRDRGRQLRTGRSCASGNAGWTASIRSCCR